MNSFNFKLRKDRKNKKGECPILFEAYAGRAQARKSIDLFVMPELWSESNSCVISGQFADFINMKLNRIRFKAQELIYKLKIEKIEMSAGEFLATVLDDGNKNRKSVDAFFETFISLKNYNSTHIKAYNTLKSHLLAYRPGLTFNQINYTFCAGFAVYLRNTAKNQPNTLLKKIQYLRCFLAEAQKHGLINDNPAKEIKIKKTPTNRTALTLDELQKLESLYRKNCLTENQQNVLHFFLFASYSGLRYGDLIKLNGFQLKTEKIIDFLSVIQEKTKVAAQIPLIDKAKELVTERKLVVISNQRSNDHLKTIAVAAGLNKPLTCHIARHTFASIGINSGIPLAVVSRCLGHTSIKTTQIYAAMSNEFLKKEMTKWGCYK